MPNVPQFALRAINQTWLETLGRLSKMPLTSVRPQQPSDIFKRSVDPSGAIKFEVAPIVLRIPEKPNGNKPNLFVVVSGWISFEAALDDGGQLRTRSYNTKVAYFRAEHSNLWHVYGTHYDLDPLRIGHPVFHAQMSPALEMADSIKTHHPGDWAGFDKGVGNLLRHVRVPTAQMDVFAVLLQIASDHLVNSESSEDVKTQYYHLRTIVEAFLGAAEDQAGLQRSIQLKCHRSPHWYRSEP